MKLSHSRIMLHQKCGRKYRYENIVRRVPRTASQALTFGRGIHKALEAILMERDTTLAPLKDEQEQHRLDALMYAYRRPEGLEVEAVEHEFEVPIPGTRDTIGGKIDVVGRRESRLWIVEHKSTTKEIEGYGPFWQALSIDHQLCTYLPVTGAEGCVYDVIRKPQIRRTKKENWAQYRQRLDDVIYADPKKHFQQRDIRLTPDEIEQAWRDLTAQALQLEWAYQNDCWPRNSGACQSNRGMCRYLDVCVGSADIHNDAIFRTRSISHEHSSHFHERL